MTISPVKIWRNQKNIAKILGKTGIIESYTTIYVPPSGFEGQAPYAVVLVNLGNSKMVAQLVDFEKEDLTMGRKVIAVLRRVKDSGKEGVIPYGIKFRPI